MTLVCLIDDEWRATSNEHLLSQKFIMQKLILCVAFFCLGTAICQLHAQSITNKCWKSYIGTPINDTAFFCIYRDSSIITNSKGDVMVRQHYTINGDTLTILDFGTEEQGCSDIKGTYKINFADNSFNLSLINDPCEGRSQAFTGKKWTEVIKK
jgi:hypothetical protein